MTFAATSPGCVLLVGTYDLGHQSFGLASPAAWLSAAGYDVYCLDLSREELDAGLVGRAAVIAFFVPMHTATRLALEAFGAVREINPNARVCFYGLYGQANSEHLVALGADAVISGEYESELVDYVQSTLGSSVPDERRLTLLERLEFKIPNRSGLPPLAEYAQLAIGDARRIVGYTESTRGCRHLCRHCPVSPVYNGAIRVVQSDVVLADVEAQVAAGAQHITFGDPDFFNASAHAVRVVSELHRRWPDLTYDVTIKVEHLLKHRRLLPTLATTGCLFVISAIESIDDLVLRYLDKGHTCADFVEAVGACREAGLTLNPTFVTFHPWLSREMLLHTFEVLDELDLVGSVSPIQLTIRLLVPAGSLLLEVPELRSAFDEFDPDRLVHPWAHPDPLMDELQSDLESLVARGGREGWNRYETFDRMWALAGGRPPVRVTRPETDTPRFLENWYCCSEPVGEQGTGWAKPQIST